MRKTGENRETKIPDFHVIMILVKSTNDLTRYEFNMFSPSIEAGTS